MSGGLLDALLSSMSRDPPACHPSPVLLQAIKKKGSRPWKSLNMREKGRLLGALDHLSFDWAERIRSQGGERAETWLWQVGCENGRGKAEWHARIQGGHSLSPTALAPPWVAGLQGSRRQLA